MQSLKWPMGSKIRLKWTVPWFSVFVDQKNLKIIWKCSLSQYKCHKTPINIENCVKNELNSNHRKQNFTVITNWGAGDYQLRNALAAKQIWVAVITIWGTLDSLPHLTDLRQIRYTYIRQLLSHGFIGLELLDGLLAAVPGHHSLP